MKIAFLNIENLYHRDKGLVRSNLSKCAADWILELNKLLPRIKKNDNDLARIRELTFLLGFDGVDSHPYGVLRKRNGELFLKLRDFAKESKASRLTDWNGWVAIQTVALNHESILNKARLIAEVDADVLVLQEVEDRASLVEFNKTLKDFNITPYEQLLVLDGNNHLGLGMAIMIKNGYSLDTVKCVPLTMWNDVNTLTELDCHEYTIITPKGVSVPILSTYFSKDNPIVRKRQARAIAEIYDSLKMEEKKIAILCGTLNDVSYSDTLSPLLRETDFEDVSRHSKCVVDKDKGKGAGYFRLGAYRMGVNIKQKDYMLLSQEVNQRLIRCGINRKGMWPERNMDWEVYPTITKAIHAASSHPLIWGEFNIE